MTLTEVAHRSRHHRAAIEAGGPCSCFHCLTVFGGDMIKVWVDGGDTAVCPTCGVDAVLPGAVGPQELQSAYLHWFEPGYLAQASSRH